MTDYESDSYYLSAESCPPSRSHQSQSANEALIEATASFNLRGVLKLLEAGIDPNEPLEDGITALHIAANADRDRVYVMQALLDYNADPNVQSEDGVTPLHVAATWGKLESIKLLLANNADPRVRDLSGKTPLDCSHELRYKECSSYLREILQGRAIPKSVADVFDELDFESFHTQFLTQSEPVLEDYLSDFISAPRSKEARTSRGKHRNKSKKQTASTPSDLDTSDEQFLTELNQVLRSDVLADRELEKYEQKSTESENYTKPPAKNIPKNKSSREHPHKRTHSSPAVVNRTQKIDPPPPRKHLLNMSHQCPDQTSEEEIDTQNRTFTKSELYIPSRNKLNETFELFQEESSVLPLDRMNTGFSDEIRPMSPSLANVDLADSDATLTLFNSDDSDFHKSRPNSKSQTKSIAKPSYYARLNESSSRGRVLGEQGANSGDVVSNLIKAEELMARNRKNRATLLYENQTNTPEVVIQKEIQEFAYNRPVDKPIETARLPDKLSDTANCKPMLSADPTESACNEENNLHTIDFATSQPYAHNADAFAHVVDSTEADIDDIIGDEYRRRALDYSQRESYIRHPEGKKKTITKKIGEIVSKSKSITSKPKLSINKPNFLKSKDTKQSTANDIPDMNFHISDISQDHHANTRAGANTVSPSSFHSPDISVPRAYRTSTGTQTITETPSPSSIRPEHTKSHKSSNKSKNKVSLKPTAPDIQALSAKLDREYLYNGNNSPVSLYPQLSDSTEQITYEDTHRDTPPIVQAYSTSSPSYAPDKPLPYQFKKPQTQDFSHSPYTNTDTPNNPNSFTNPYLDTTTSPHSSSYTHSAAKSVDPQLYIPTESDRDSYTSLPPANTAPPAPPAPLAPALTSTLSSQSPNPFVTLLEEVNRSLPYELKLTDTPTTTPPTPRSPSTPTLPSSLKHGGHPTPFTQVGFSPENPSPVLSSKSLTPRSKRRVTIVPTPTEVQFCDEYDRTPVMPSLNLHISSDDSDEAREETTHHGVQSGGTYVPPPPYQHSPPATQHSQVSDILDTTVDLDPSSWKDSPSYICLDEYLKQNSQEHTPRPSVPLSPSAPIPPQLNLLSDKQLREELVKIGEQPGPITSITRPLYMRYLSKVKQEPALHSSNCFQGYLYELAQVLMGTRPIPNEQVLETEMCHYFDNPPQNCSWREGINKESFNYILIDPRISQNLPSQIAELSELDRFRIFIESIFYIGKGKRSRPYSHLYEAINCENSDSQPKPKQQRILDIWASGQGVVSLHCFQGIIAVEAFTREACLLEAVGLHKLTNTKRGEYYGVVSEWDGSKKRRLGVYLLHRAMHILIAEGERQICKENLTGK